MRRRRIVKVSPNSYFIFLAFKKQNRKNQYGPNHQTRSGNTAPSNCANRTLKWHIPGSYAESHLRVQKSCSWFPIGHLPSYGESAHFICPSVRADRRKKKRGDTDRRSLRRRLSTTPLAKYELFDAINGGQTVSCCTSAAHAAMKETTHPQFPVSLPLVCALFQSNDKKNEKQFLKK